MKRILQYIILIGVFTLPLINSRITNLLGLSFSLPVSGNFEFTKVMFFNVWSSVVLSLFFIYTLFSHQVASLKGGRIVGIYFFYIILIFSTYFSVSPYISFFGNAVKSHSFLVWSNLIGLFIVLHSLIGLPTIFVQKEKEKEKEGDTGDVFFLQIINTFVFSGICVALIGFKEYLYPTFEYGDLGKRLFSTFGHPNYLSIFLISFIPFFYFRLLKINVFFQTLLTLLFVTTLFYTKSFIAIFLFLCFNLYYFWDNIPYKKNVFSILILFFSVVIFTFFPEKLHSFVSRFFIWETSIRVIFSDIKIFFLGGGTETFVHYFDNFKSQYLYIFENLGFSADRPHNVILNFFFHFGVGGLMVIMGIYYKIFSTHLAQTDRCLKSVHLSIILILLFLLFNPTSIIIYLLLVVLLAFIYKRGTGGDYVKLGGIDRLLMFVIMVFSIVGSYFSVLHFYSETESYNNNFVKAQNIYKYSPNNYFFSGQFSKGLDISKVQSVEYYFLGISLASNQYLKERACNNYTNTYSYAESYFYCGDIFWDLGNTELAQKYYRSGLELLPDLWDKKSKYYDSYLLKIFHITGHRFFSEKYGLAEILRRSK